LDTSHPFDRALLSFEAEAPDMARILNEEAAGTRRSRERAVWTRLRRFAKAVAAADRLHQYVANPNLALQALAQMPLLGWEVSALSTYPPELYHLCRRKRRCLKPSAAETSLPDAGVRPTGEPRDVPGGA